MARIEAAFGIDFASRTMRPILKKLILALLVTGALTLCLLVVAGPRIYRHYLLRIPAVSEWEFRRVLERRKVQLAQTRWEGARVHLFAGDSHIESGHWNELCGDRIDARNVGLGRSKISDVEELIAAIPKQKVYAVVLM